MNKTHALAHCLLVSVSFGRPRFRKKDKELTNDTKTRHEMGEDTGYFTKALLPKDTFVEYDDTVSYLRDLFYKVSSPYSDRGSRLMTAKAFYEFSQAWRETIHRLESLRDEFLDRYDTLVSESRGRLGLAFNSLDYPSRSQLENKFKWDLDVADVPTNNTLSKIAEECRELVEHQTEKRLNEARKSIFERLFLVVKHLAEKTSDEEKTKKCHHSTLTNIRELVNTLPLLNFTDDPVLSELSKECYNLIEGLDDMSPVKGSDVLRRELNESSRKMADRISSVMNDIL